MQLQVHQPPPCYVHPDLLLRDRASILVVSIPIHSLALRVLCALVVREWITTILDPHVLRDEVRARCRRSKSSVAATPVLCVGTFSRGSYGSEALTRRAELETPAGRGPVGRLKSVHNRGTQMGCVREGDRDPTKPVPLRYLETEAQLQDPAGCRRLALCQCVCTGLYGELYR